MKKPIALLTLILLSVFSAFPVSSDAALLQDKPLKIIKKERIGPVSDRCRNFPDGLYVTVSVEFLDTGKIGDVTLIRSSRCDYFDREALRVSRLIKFNPQIKNGKPVTTTRRVDHAVTMY